MKNVPLILASVLCFSFNVLMSQSVILINGVPTQVRLEGTEVVEIKGEVKNYLAGFDSSTVSNGFQYAELRLNQKTPAVAAAPVTQPTQKQISQSSENPNVSSPVSVSSPFISGNYFKFENDNALLSEVSLKEIKVYSEKIKSGKATSVLLESFHVNGDSGSIQLVRNRLDACKNYFEINGVPSNLIVTNMYPNDKESDKVSVTLR